MKKLKYLFLTNLALAAVPSDVLFPQQWHLQNDGTQEIYISIDESHTSTQKGVAGVDVGFIASRDEVVAKAKTEVLVAVLDFGIDPNHPDFKDRISPLGFDFIENKNTLKDEFGHGTHVSGIIAANCDNSMGVCGLAPAPVKILPLRVLSDDFKNFTYKDRFVSDYAADAIRYAIKNKAAVINMSLGWPKLVDTVNARNAINEAINAGVVVVVSAGNDKKNLPSYPCSYPGVICVGSVTNNGNLAIFSDWGGSVDILAPGEGIVSTYPMNVDSRLLRVQGYESLDGTSQAAPQISAIAAILKSTNPGMTADEIKARILIGARAPKEVSTEGISLYGIARINESLHAKAQPVYLPDFKSMESLVIDESTLEIKNKLSVKNLWAGATNVVADVEVNGIKAGHLEQTEIQSGQSLEIPWSYQFKSLEESSEMTMKLTMVDSTGQSKVFSTQFMVARPMEDMKAPSPIIFDPSLVKASEWLGADKYGHKVTRFNPVFTYGTDKSYPSYFQQIGAGVKGSQVLVFDSAQSLTRTLDVPFIGNVHRVFRAEVTRDGKMAWVITGIGKNQDGNYFYQFYFLGPDFKPLWNSGWIWQFQVKSYNDSFAVFSDSNRSVLRNFAAPGSWIQGPNQNLIPSFFANGTLPDLDNFSKLDPRYMTAEFHLYYFLPDLTTATQDGRVQLQFHVVDNKAFQIAHPTGRIVNPIPQNRDDIKNGKMKFLYAEGESDLSANMSLWTVDSVFSQKLTPTTDWNLLTTVGQPSVALNNGVSDASLGYLTFIDQARGSLMWTNSKGDNVGSSQFSFSSLRDPFLNLSGIVDFPEFGKVWFVASKFSLIAFHQNGDQIESAVHSIERDASFGTGQSSSIRFDDLLKTVVVGTKQNPLPGVFIDSTFVRGDLMSVIIWDPQTKKLVRPLRYSMRLPKDCLQMQLTSLSDDPSSFSVPLLCAQNNSLRLILVRPQDELAI